jgi:predicted dehydrogenase
MSKVKIGIFGVRRGSSVVKYCRTQPDVQLVAICDKWEQGLMDKKKELGEDIAYYTSFDDFIKHDMDAVVLANYANEHAPYAIRCMERGLHVLSEVLPCQTMAEAVQLVETVGKTGKVYAYAENYCFMAAPYEMRKLYRSGKLGEFEYGEGEYMHNCESIWPIITRGEKHHWRNNIYATFYCTHSIGPLIHITGLLQRRDRYTMYHYAICLSRKVSEDLEYSQVFLLPTPIDKQTYREGTYPTLHIYQ